MQHRGDIDGLRAIAVILILFFHLRLINVPGGFIGVDVFFVISGFLITNLIIRDVTKSEFSFGRFYIRRLRRLGPALLVTLAITLLVGWFILPPNLYQETAQAAFASVASVSNFYFWQLADYFDTAAAYKPLLHTWSLGVEEQFYLLWPALLLLGTKFLSKTGLLAALVIVSLISLALSEALLSQHASAAFFLTPFRIYELSIGAILAVGGWQARGPIAANAASVVGFFIILYVATTYTDKTTFPGVNALLPAGAAALLIYGGPAAIVNRALAVPPIRYIGRISYSVYLVHVPLFVYYLFLFGEATTSAAIGGLILGALTLGAISYHLVETPFRATATQGFVISAPRLGGFCLAAAAFVSLSSGLIYAQGGFKTRYDPEIIAILEERDQAYLQRFNDTGEWTCNATQNSKTVYFDVFDDCQPSDRKDMIVVLGDSHAADIFMGLQAAHPDRAIVQLTGNGCNFTKQLDGGNPCADYMQFWQNWITENADNTAAIIYSQSSGSLISRAAGGIDRPNPALVNTMHKTLDGFVPAEVPLFFWGPRPGFDPAIDIAIAGSKTRDDLRVYYEGARRGADFALDAWLSQYYADKQIRYISSAGAICTPYCPTLTDEDVLFVVDHAHWSPKGAIAAVTAIVASDPELQAIFDD